MAEVKTTKKLDLNFKAADGKTKKISLAHAKDNLDANTVKSAMETIVAKNIFEKDSVDQYASAKNANMVTRSVEEIYKAEN